MLKRILAVAKKMNPVRVAKKVCEPFLIFCRICIYFACLKLTFFSAIFLFFEIIKINNLQVGMPKRILAVAKKINPVRVQKKVCKPLQLQSVPNSGKDVN